MKETAADHISRRMQAAAIGDLNHGRIGIGMRIWSARVSWINADVMTRTTRDQLALCCDRPLFEVRCQPVGICENKICKTCFVVFSGPLRGASESSDHNGERRRRIAGVFLPSILRGNRPLQNQVCRGAHNHYPGIEQAERVLFMQTPRQKYRESNLVKL